MKTNLELYVLSEKGEPVPEDDIEKWALWYQDGDGRRIASDNVNSVHVSTVFLGLPHPGGMFETMVFGGPHDQYKKRYETKAQALKGHAETVKLVTGTPPPTEEGTYATAE